MSFNPTMLNARTLKQFVDRLMAIQKKKGAPSADAWPPKRSQVQEDIAQLLGFPSWHIAIHAVEKTTPKKIEDHQHLVYPHEPKQWTPNELDKLLEWGAIKRPGDIHLASLEKVVFQDHRNPRPATQHPIPFSDTQQLVNFLAKREVSLDEGKEFFSFIHTTSGNNPLKRHYRYRVFMTLVLNNNELQWCLDFRYIPDICELDMDPQMSTEIINHLKTRRQGLVVATGSTGTGKTSTIAAITDRLLREKDGMKLITYEDPIEFVYDNINTSNIVHQRELGNGISSFSDGVHMAMRRKPTHILIGEAQNIETIQTALDAAMVGHMVHTTVFAESCADAVARILMVFDAKVRRARLIDFVSTCPTVLCVRRVKSIKGHFITLMETLFVDDALADILIETKLEDVVSVIISKMKENKQDFASDAVRKYQEGVISLDTFNAELRAYECREGYDLKKLNSSR